MRWTRDAAFAFLFSFLPSPLLSFSSVFPKRRQKRKPPAAEARATAAGNGGGIADKERVHDGNLLTKRISMARGFDNRICIKVLTDKGKRDIIVA